MPVKVEQAFSVCGLCCLQMISFSPGGKALRYTSFIAIPKLLYPRAGWSRHLCVQFHDILYTMFRDILYTPARTERGRE